MTVATASSELPDAGAVVPPVPPEVTSAAAPSPTDSSPSATPSVATPNEPVDRSAIVSVGVDELIVGRRLQFPIYDDQGMLLLAEGMLVSSDMKKNLRSRGLEKVGLNKVDAQSATLTMNQNLGPIGTFFAIDEEIAKKLDAVLDESMLRVTNNGPAVKGALVEHGRKAVTEEAKQKLVAQHTQTCSSLDNMMQDTMSGKNVSGAQVTRCAAGFLSSLIEDRDAAMSLAQEVVGDKALADHSLKMALLGMAIAIEMGMDAENVRRLGVTALVQDWGMALIPQEIREAPRQLNDIETLDIKKHPIHSLNMLQRVLGLPDITSLVAYQIHERPDGSGYPRGRDEKTIHPYARILRVADEFVSLTTPRSYRKPMMAYAAMECLLRMAKNRKVDKDAVRALLHVQGLFPIGSLVALSDGSVAQVMRRNGNHYTLPFVRRVTDSQGQPLPFDPELPLIDVAEAGLTIVQAIPTPGRDEIPYVPEMLDRRIS